VAGKVGKAPFFPVSICLAFDYLFANIEGVVKKSHARCPCQIIDSFIHSQLLGQFLLTGHQIYSHFLNAPCPMPHWILHRFVDHLLKLNAKFLQLFVFTVPLHFTNPLPLNFPAFSLTHLQPPFKFLNHCKCTNTKWRR